MRQRIGKRYSELPALYNYTRLLRKELESDGVLVPIAIPVPWKGLLDEITLKYEPIYHTTIAEKLKKIAKLK